MRVARATRRELPTTGAALREGRISFDHARVLAGAVNDRIAEQFAVLEPQLVDLAEHMVFDRWRRHVATVAALLDGDGGYDPHADLGANRLSVQITPDGTYLSGCLVGDAAVVTDQAIEQLADELFRAFAEDARRTEGEIAIPDRSALRALALAEACRRALAVDLHSSQAPGIEATLVIPAEAPHHVSDRTGLPVPPIAAATLACDLTLHPVVLDRLGVPVDMGREIRTANRAQRRALAARDGGCVFPGCGAPPSHCDAHHIAHWTRDLGRTDVGSMASLCRRHHGVVHRAGWNVTLDDDGWARFSSPRGRCLWGQRHGVSRVGPAPPGP